MFSLIRADLERYFQLDLDDPGGQSAAAAVPPVHRQGFTFSKLKFVLTQPSLHCVLTYRFGAWVYRTVRFPLLRFPLNAAYHVLDFLCTAIWGVHIDVRAKIGGGLYLAHVGVGGILIGPVTMGDDCSVGHQVTIGRRANGSTQVPTIGNRVWIGVGCVVFGGIRIGDGVSIGPLTVVARTLPPQVLVIGNPMKLLRRNYDNSLEIYGRPRATENRDESAADAFSGTGAELAGDTSLAGLR